MSDYFYLKMAKIPRGNIFQEYLSVSTTGREIIELVKQKGVIEADAALDAYVLVTGPGTNTHPLGLDESLEHAGIKEPDILEIIPAEMWPEVKARREEIKAQEGS